MESTRKDGGRQREREKERKNIGMERTFNTDGEARGGGGRRDK